MSGREAATKRDTLRLSGKTALKIHSTHTFFTTRGCIRELFSCNNSCQFIKTRGRGFYWLLLRDQKKPNKQKKPHTASFSRRFTGLRGSHVWCPPLHCDERRSAGAATCVRHIMSPSSNHTLMPEALHSAPPRPPLSHPPLPLCLCLSPALYLSSPSSPWPCNGISIGQIATGIRRARHLIESLIGCLMPACC